MPEANIFEPLLKLPKIHGNLNIFIVIFGGLGIKAVLKPW